MGKIASCPTPTQWKFWLRRCFHAVLLLIGLLRCMSIEGRNAKCKSLFIDKGDLEKSSLLYYINLELDLTTLKFNSIFNCRYFEIQPQQEVKV